MKIKVKNGDKYKEQEVIMNLDNITNESGNKIEKLQAERAGCYQPDFQKEYDLKKSHPEMSQEERSSIAIRDLDVEKLMDIENKIYKILIDDAYGVKGKTIPYLDYLKLKKEIKKADPLKIEHDKKEYEKTKKKVKRGGK